MPRKPKDREERNYNFVPSSVEVERGRNAMPCIAAKEVREGVEHTVFLHLSPMQLSCLIRDSRELLRSCAEDLIHYAEAPFEAPKKGKAKP